ncbi:transglutaminase family protein [Candidatus Parcubacteria bacterium]|nr:MAG: transglutaminase family protein [Candidatus Parcubacteria bacterium]
MGRPSFLSEIPSGRAGVRETLKRMAALIQYGKLQPAIRDLAVSLTKGLSPKDFAGEIEVLHKFVRDRIRYVRDTNGVETLHLPEIVLEIGSGDCDDKVILLASLLESIGHPTRSVAISLAPGQFSHVLLETRPQGFTHWIPLETTEPVPAGWKPPGIVDTMVQHNSAPVTASLNMERSIMALNAVLFPTDYNPADKRTLRRGSQMFGQGRTRVANLMNSAVDLDRTYAIRQRGAPENELVRVLQRVLSPEYGYQSSLGELTPTQTEAVQVAKEILQLFKEQRARALAVYNKMVNTEKSRLSTAVKNMTNFVKAKNVLKLLRVDDPGNDIVRLAAIVQNYLKKRPKEFTSGNRRNMLNVSAVLAWDGAEMVKKSQLYLDTLLKVLYPVSEAQMDAELKAGKFKLYTDNCGHRYVFTDSERTRALDYDRALFDQMYTRNCPGKSFWDQLKQIAVPAAIMIAVPAAINYLATGSVGWGGAASSAAPAASAAPVASSAIPATAVKAAVPLATSAVPSAAAITTAAAPSAVASIAKAIDTGAQIATQAASVQQAVNSVKAAQSEPAKIEPLTIPITEGQTSPSAGNLLIPALIGGALLLLTMR